MKKELEKYNLIIERDDFGNWVVIGNDGSTLGRYATKKDATEYARDRIEEYKLIHGK